MSEGKTIQEMRHDDRYSHSPDYADGYDEGIATQAAQIEALTKALERLCADAEITGLDKEAGWDCWFAQARAALSNTGKK